MIVSGGGRKKSIFRSIRIKIGSTFVKLAIKTIGLRKYNNRTIELEHTLVLISLRLMRSGEAVRS